MAIEKVIDIKVQGNVNEAVGSLRSQLREAQAEVAALSEKFGVTSVEAANAARRAAELKDQIGDAKALTDAFNPDAKFRALTSSLSGVAGGFAAVQGGMALFGAQSEEVEATLLKVQSAMALSQGIQAVGESIDSFKQLSAVVQNSTAFQKVNSAVTATAAVIQRVFTGAVNTTAASFNALKVAIVSTGIGALVVGIGYLVSKMNEGAAAAKELTKEQEGLNRQLEYTKQLSDDAAKSLDYQTQRELADAKKRGASDRELTQIKIDGINERIRNNAREIDDIIATKGQEYLLTKEQNKRIQDLRTQNLDLLRQGRLEVANFEADQAVKARERETNDATKARENRIAEYQKDKAETIRQSEEIDELTYRLRKGTVDKVALLNVESIASYLGKQQDAAAKEIEIQKQKEAAMQEVRMQGLDNVASIGRSLQVLAGKNKDVARAGIILENAAGIARIVVNTMIANTKAVAAFPLSAGQPFVGINTAAGALSIAASIKATQTALSQIGGGGGSAGNAPSMSVAGGAGGTNAPQFNVVGSTGVNQLAGAIGNREAAPVQAYVVANNVTTAQSLDRNIIQSATLGG
jgi:hypothetical protein